MSDIHALSGAYAVDALDEHERHQFERHLAECADCRAEVDSLREAAATLPGIAQSTPPASLRDSVLSEISTVRPLPPVTAGTGSRRTSRFPRLLAAAAAVIAVVGTGVLIAQPWDQETSQHELTAAERVVTAADARSLSVDVKGVEATLFVSDSLGQAALVSEELPAIADDEVYELWLQTEDAMLPAGLMTDPDEPFLLEGSTHDAIGAGLSIEPAGGSPRPTNPLALFPFAQAT